MNKTAESVAQLAKRILFHAYSRTTVSSQHCFKHWQLFTLRFLLFGNVADRK